MKLRRLTGASIWLGALAVWLVYTNPTYIGLSFQDARLDKADPQHATLHAVVTDTATGKTWNQYWDAKTSSRSKLTIETRNWYRVVGFPVWSRSVRIDVPVNTDVSGRIKGYVYSAVWTKKNG